jgi:excisionase family DNA binding protein
MTSPEKESNAPLLLSVKEVAAALAISVSGVYRLIDAGELHRLKVGGRTLFERSELERYIAGQRLAGASHAGVDARSPVPLWSC